jgi:hypothetical protein
VGAALAVLAVTGAPHPAAAHTGGGAASSDYVVTATVPADAGVHVEVGPGGQWVQVIPQTAQEVVVLGSSGRPFLRWRDGVVAADAASQDALTAGLVGFEDRRRAVSEGSSPSGAALPSPAGAPLPVDGQAAASWVRLEAATSLRWADARVDPARPPGPAPQDGSPATVTMPLQVDGVSVPVRVTLRHVPGPSPVIPLAAVAGLAALLGWAAGTRHGRTILVVGSAAAGVTTFVHITGATLATASGLPWTSVAGSMAAGLLCWPFAAAAVVAGLRGSEHAPFLHLLTGATVLILGGPSDAVSMWRSQLVFAGPTWLDRGLVIAAFGLGLGLIVGGYRQLSRAAADASTPQATLRAEHAGGL